MSEQKRKTPLQIPEVDINTEEPNAVCDWSKADKFELLNVLQKYGSKDLNKLQEQMPSKSLEQIQAALTYYKEKAFKHPALVNVQPKARPNAKTPINPQNQPLLSWADLLLNTQEFNNLQTDVSTALRMIADLEDFPDKAKTDNIDFKNIYYLLANAVEGKPLPKDKSYLSILNKLIVDTAISGKDFISPMILKEFIAEVSFDDKLSPFPRPTDDIELSSIRHLASSKKYNPLKVPECYLKPSDQLYGKQ